MDRRPKRRVKVSSEEYSFLGSVESSTPSVSGQFVLSATVSSSLVDGRNDGGLLSLTSPASLSTEPIETSQGKTTRDHDGDNASQAGVSVCDTSSTITTPTPQVVLSPDDPFAMQIQHVVAQADAAASSGLLPPLQRDDEYDDADRAPTPLYGGEYKSSAEYSSEHVAGTAAATAYVKGTNLFTNESNAGLRTGANNTRRLFSKNQYSFGGQLQQTDEFDADVVVLGRVGSGGAASSSGGTKSSASSSLISRSGSGAGATADPSHSFALANGHSTPMADAPGNDHDQEDEVLLRRNSTAGSTTTTHSTLGSSGGFGNQNLHLYDVALDDGGRLIKTSVGEGDDDDDGDDHFDKRMLLLDVARWRRRRKDGTFVWSVVAAVVLLLLVAVAVSAIVGAALLSGGGQDNEPLPSVIDPTTQKPPPMPPHPGEILPTAVPSTQLPGSSTVIQPSLLPTANLNSLLPTPAPMSKPPSSRPSAAPSLVPTISSSPTVPPTTAPTSTIQVLLARESEDGGKALGTPGTPQNTALRWIVETDQFKNLWEIDFLERLVQRYAVVCLYFATGGPTHWQRRGIGAYQWLNETTDVCQWDDVICNGELVELIDRRYNGLIGQIPNEIGLVTTLQNLVVGGNKIGGTIPEALGNLTELKFLRLDENDFTGTIPLSFANLQNLEILDLKNNFLHGTIPRIFGKMESLSELKLGGNRLVGDIEGFNGVQNLTVLELNSNQLTGDLFFGLGSSKLLKRFILNDNKLTSIIPEGMTEFTALVTLNLSNNELDGSLPSGFGNLIELEDFSVASNQLTGTIPEDFKRMRKLRTLQLEDNEFTGEVPPDICQQDEIRLISADCDSADPEIICECCRLCF